MRTENNTPIGPPIRPRCTRALGSKSSTHDASRLGCREAARCVVFRVTHAILNFVARRDTSPYCFGFRVALRDTPDRQSEQSRREEPRQKLRGRLTIQTPKETKYA